MEAKLYQRNNKILDNDMKGKIVQMSIDNSGSNSSRNMSNVQVHIQYKHCERRKIIEL